MRQGPFSTSIQKLPTLVFALLLSSSVAMAQRGYVRSDGVNAVVYRGYDGDIYELSLLGDGWQNYDLSYLAGAPAGAAEFSFPAPYVRSDGINSVVYRGIDRDI